MCWILWPLSSPVLWHQPQVEATSFDIWNETDSS
jgi:hypothetical protein